MRGTGIRLAGSTCDTWPVASSSDAITKPRDESRLDQVGVDPVELIDSSPDGIVVTDTDGTILLVNRAAESMFDYSRS